MTTAAVGSDDDEAGVRGAMDDGAEHVIVRDGRQRRLLAQADKAGVVGRDGDEHPAMRRIGDVGRDGGRGALGTGALKEHPAVAETDEAAGEVHWRTVAGPPMCRRSSSSCAASSGRMSLASGSCSAK